MSLDKAAVEKIAWLARLAIDDRSLPGYQAELEQILELVSRMDTAATAEIPPLAHPLDLQARLRPDQVTETDQRDRFQAFAPAVRDNHYLVPKVIE